MGKTVHEPASGPAREDDLTRLIVVAYLVVTGILFAAGTMLMLRPPPRLAALVIAVALIPVSVGWLALRRILSPLATLALVVVLVTLVARALGRGAGHPAGTFEIELLQLPVMTLVLAWLLLRRFQLYRRWRSVRVAIVLALGMAASAAVVPGAIAVGRESASALRARRAPDELVGLHVGRLEFVSTDGRPIRLDRPGELYVLDFWAPSCKPCLDELPELIALQQELQASGTAELLLVVERSHYEMLRDWLARRYPTERFALDEGAVMRKFGITAVPTKLFVRDGVILDVMVGAHRPVRDVLRARLRRLVRAAR